MSRSVGLSHLTSLWGQKVQKSTCVFTSFCSDWQTVSFSLCICSCGQEEPTYSALWGDNKAFNEVIISPAMLNEHMPHMVMEGLNKVCFICVHAYEFLNVEESACK